jgi:hypothetical protein
MVIKKADRHTRKISTGQTDRKVEREMMEKNRQAHRQTE